MAAGRKSVCFFRYIFSKDFSLTIENFSKNKFLVSTDHFEKDSFEDADEEIEESSDPPCFTIGIKPFPYLLLDIDFESLSNAENNDTGDAEDVDADGDADGEVDKEYKVKLTIKGRV